MLIPHVVTPADNDFALDLAEITENHVLTNAFKRLYNDHELASTKLKNRLQIYILGMDKMAGFL
jgi:hypothetical protein